MLKKRKIGHQKKDSNYRVCLVMIMTMNKAIFTTHNQGVFPQVRTFKVLKSEKQQTNKQTKKERL